MDKATCRTCEGCGEDYTPRRRDQRYCTRACNRSHGSAQRQRRRHLRICERCGTEWLAEKATHRFCTVRCASLTQWDEGRARGRSGPFGRRPPIVMCGPACRVSQRPKSRTWIAGRCQRCDRSLVTCGKRTHKYCSRRCMHQAHKGANRGAKVPNVIRLRVLRRDDYVCRICRKPIDRHRAPPHPKSATIDHILPQSLGGDDAETNLQAAHYGCNSSKGNRIKQLALGC